MDRCPSDFGNVTRGSQRNYVPLPRSGLAASAATTVNAGPLENRPLRSHRWQTLGLSLLNAAAGHLYLGAATLALLIWMIDALLFVVLLLWLVFSPWPYWNVSIAAIAYLVWRIGVAGHAIILERQQRHRPAPPSRLSTSKRWVLFVAMYVSNWFATFSFRAACAEAFVLPSRGMASTLLPGDHVLVEKLTLQFRPPQRGDIVTYWPPSGIRSLWIARIVAVPGDDVGIDDGHAVINGVVQSEPFATFVGEVPPPDDPVRNLPGRRLGPGEYFIVGDNRWRSNDSRLLGPIARDAITRRFTTVYWSSVVRQREWQFDDMPDLDPGRANGAIRWERVGLRPAVN